MNLSERKKTTVITKPSLDITLKVLHNLWFDGHLDIFDVSKILRLDYECVIQDLELDFICVESLDGLTKHSIGKKQ